MSFLRKVSFGMVFISFVISHELFAQTPSKIDKRNYEVNLDSLQSMKKELFLLKQKLRLSIDSLSEYLENLKQQLKNEQRELIILKYGEEDGGRVANGQVWKGMSEDMLKDSWGTPDKIDKNVEKWGVFTQWYYGNVTFFFRDGKLTDWEEIK